MSLECSPIFGPGANQASETTGSRGHHTQPGPTERRKPQPTGSSGGASRGQLAIHDRAEPAMESHDCQCMGDDRRPEVEPLGRANRRRFPIGAEHPIGRIHTKEVLPWVPHEVRGHQNHASSAQGGDASVWAEFGTRFQLSNSTVLDFGITSRLDQWTDGIANLGLVIGVSRVFGIAGLIKVPPYPNPRIN